MPAEKFVILKNFSIGAILYFDEMLPSWVFMWARKLQAKAKRLLHNSQACGLSPVSISRPSINFPNVDDQHHNIEKGTTWETKQKPKKKSNKIFFFFQFKQIIIYNSNIQLYTIGFPIINSFSSTNKEKQVHKYIWSSANLKNTRPNQMLFSNLALYAVHRNPMQFTVLSTFCPNVLRFIHSKSWLSFDWESQKWWASHL